MSRRKVLITGSCGFVLGNFLRKAIYEKLPYQFISVDKVRTDSPNSMYWNKNHIFYIADVTDQHIMDSIFQLETPDIVIHGAGERSTDKSFKDPNLIINSNVLGTQAILNSCVKYNVEKIVYISTDQVYGQLSSENDTSWKEDDLVNPRNLYAVTKASAEMLIKTACQSSKLNYNILRTSNIYGPRQTADKLIPKTIKSITNQQDIFVYGQGLQMRDWLHAFDFSSALISILNKGVNNEIYNISSGQEFTNIEVIQKVCNSMESGYNLVRFVEDRPLNDFRYSMNSSKIRNLGWKPQFKLSEGIHQSVEWYKFNQWFIK